MTGGQFQYKKPLDTCPEEFRAYHVGDCGTCGRPMAPNRLMQRMPELKTWFMHANNAVLCRSCYSHQTEERAPRSRPARVPRLTPDLILWLRAEIGACLTCGWLPDVPDEDGTMESHGDRGCPESVAVEPRSLVDEDLLRETA